ncbi:hypothetical protein BGV40_00205 [Methanosarcina sp. Ant1]|nr:hypothetical protein BGV40_00205 [Methanosarcina sp. Ant1]
MLELIYPDLPNIARPHNLGFGNGKFLKLLIFYISYSHNSIVNKRLEAVLHNYECKRRGID